MCRNQGYFVVIALLINLVHPWEFATTTGDQIEFYNNKTKLSSEGVRFRDLTVLSYDAVHNMLLFVDKQNENASIFSYHLAKKKYQALVRSKPYENIQGIAFDPIQKILFWSDSNQRSIYWISLKPGSKNDVYGNLLIKMDAEIPRALAVDSCRGYIYWTNINITNPTIERARFDGSGREVIISKNIFMPVSLVVDQQTRKLYWADDREGIHYSIDSSDFSGHNQKTLYSGTDHQPNALTVSKDSVYWVDWGFKSVWKLSKNLSHNGEPQEIIHFHDNPLFGIAANYQIEDQTSGISECKTLASLSQNKSEINDTFTVTRVMELFCLNGVSLEDKCVCSAGFTGEHCEISICQNYCLEGECIVTPAGTPECRCKSGFVGNRCESNICWGFCMNNGVCSVVQAQKPVCECTDAYEGDRCQTSKSSARSSILKTLTVNTSEICNCTENQIMTAENINEEEFIQTNECNQEWDSVRDPIIMALGVLSGLLCIACAILITKIMHLKRRPRIKKRIIVNKNGTPLTARPAQCEITIENCCNMNICETPCFEPRTTIRPSLLEAKPGKEEKRNLIANMEHPDDF